MHPAASTGGQVAELAGFDTASGDCFGWSSAISGNIIVVGAPNHGGDAGRAYVFTRSPHGQWNPDGELVGPDTGVGDNFGLSVAISGTTIVVGAPLHASKARRACVFTRIAQGWKQTAELVGSDTVAGDDFGWSVAPSGTIIVVGAHGHASGAGRAYVFTKGATGWRRTAVLSNSQGLGMSVAISGTDIVASNGLAAYTFTTSTTGWRQTAKLWTSNDAGHNLFGWSLAVSGTTVVVGAIFASSARLVYVFQA